MMNESAIGQSSKPSPTTPPSGSTIPANFSAPIFLLGSHKSGTTLLRNLLDGADGHFVIPVETHLFPLAGFWVQYALRQSLPRTLTYEQFRDGLLAHIDRSNRIVSETSDSNLVGHWNMDAFRAALDTELRSAWETQNWRAIYNAYVWAIHVGLFGTAPTAHRFVEKSVENAEYAAMLQDWYPDAKFLHIVRNPYATIVALRRHSAVRRYPYLGPIVQAMASGYYHAYKNPLIMENYRVVRFEDLLLQPELIMGQIADFVGIEFTEVLLTPTTMGEIWQGNSAVSGAFAGISQEPLRHWEKRITPLEAQMVAATFGHVLELWEYPAFDAERSPYRRCEREAPKTYFANRFLLRTLARDGLSLPL